MRVGLLSFHFYNTTAEGLATAKLAKALTNAGHAVTVFTSRDNPLTDGATADSVGPLAGIKVHRVGPGLDLVPRWWSALQERATRSSAWDKLGAVPNLFYGCQAHEWGWVQNVAREFLRVSKSDDGFDVLHTRLNHPISHLAGLEITKHSRFPWCAYFSDPWPYHLYPEPYEFTVGPATRYRSEQILNRILVRAGSYIFPTTRLRDHLLKGNRARFLPKAFVAPHLTTSWGEVRAADSDGMVRIRHSGFLMRERKIESLFDGLREFIKRRPKATSRICIEFAGRYQGNKLPEPPADLGSVVQFHSYMEPDAVWDWLQGADIFLLVEAQMKEGIFFPSKLADYLGGGRPILALSPARGVTADCLADGGGIVVEPNDVEGISVALMRLYDAWEAGTLMRLAPNQAQVASVSPDQVVPVYEQAFRNAIQHG